MDNAKVIEELKSIERLASDFMKLSPLRTSIVSICRGAIDQLERPQGSASSRDAKRYQRLRVLGCAPYGSPHLDKGEVLRFQNLDAAIDCDIELNPSRGEVELEEPTDA